MRKGFKKYMKTWNSSQKDFDNTILIQISLKFSRQLIFMAAPVKRYYNNYLLIPKLAIFHHTVFHHNSKHKQHGENVVILNKQDMGINW